MKFILYSILTLSLLVNACSEAEQEGGGQILEYSEEMDFYEENDSIIDEEEEGEFEIDYTEVFFARIGLYSDKAILVIKHYPEEDGKIPLKGYYFYIKNQKNLQLEGYTPVNDKSYYLTESYKGETTGYMEFIPDDKSSIWKTSEDAEETQPLYCTKIDGGKPESWTLALQYDQYEDPHQITMYMGEEEGEVVEDVVDDLIG